MDPQWIVAICAGVTLLIYWTATSVGAVVAIFRKIDRSQEKVLADVNKKHEENRVRVDAIQQLVIRHDAWLNPEYNGTGKSPGRGHHG